MTTFLPYESYWESSLVLDSKRLGKQRAECLYLLKLMLVDTDKEPKGATKLCVRMWSNNIVSLGLYTLVMCKEWKARNYVDNVADQVRLLIPGIDLGWIAETPKWLGNPDFHASHRSNLLRKDPVHYRKYEWTEPNNLPYVWPSGE